MTDSLYFIPTTYNTTSINGEKHYHFYYIRQINKIIFDLNKIKLFLVCVSLYNTHNTDIEHSATVCIALHRPGVSNIK